MTSPSSTAGAPRWPLVVLAAIVLLVAVALWTQAVRVHLWTQDEEYFVQLSRLISEHLPGGIVDPPVNPFDERGPQRLTVLLLMGPLSWVNGEAGMALARALLSLAFASAAVPAYLLARGVRLSYPWALGAAAATVVVPWGVLTGSFLTESVAYPVALWALWGAWRACVVPGWRSDLLAIALAVLACLGRTNLLALIIVAPSALIFQELASAGGDGGVAGRLRRAAVAMWRRHPIFAVLIPPGALLVLLAITGVGPFGKQGIYYVTFELADFSTLPEKWAGQVSRIALGIGLIPAILGLPWIVRQIGRRTSPEAGALALVGLFGFLAVLITTLYAAPEERYLMHAAPFLLIPGIVALARGEVPAWAVAVSGVLITVLVARTAWPYTEDQSRMLTDPVEAFWGRVAVRRAPDLLGEATHGAALAVLLVAIVAVAMTVLRRRGVALAVAVLVAVAALQAVVQSGYSVTKRTDYASDVGTLADYTWVDDRVGGATVGIAAEGLANSGAYASVWREVTFWNRRVEKLVAGGFVGLQIPRYGQILDVKLDRETGRLAPTGDEPIPRYLLRSTIFRTWGLVADEVERSSYLATDLVRLRGEPRLRWLWEGVADDGFLTSEQRTGRLLVLPPAFEGGGKRCLSLTLVAPPVATRTRWTVTSGAVRRTGILRADDQARVTVPAGRAGTTVDVRARGFAELADGRRAAFTIAETQLRRCP